MQDKKKHPSPRESFLPPVHSDTRPSILSHFLPFLSLEKLATSSFTKAFGQPLHAGPTEPHIRPPAPQVLLSLSTLWRGDSQKVTMWYGACCHFVPFSPQLKRTLKRGGHNRHYSSLCSLNRPTWHFLGAQPVEPGTILAENATCIP